MNQKLSRLLVALTFLLCATLLSATVGGPDTYGYMFKDSNETDGPAYSWITPSTTNAVTDLGDDAISAALPMGINFPFYDNVYTDIYVCSNGFLAFNGDNSTYNNAAIPTPGAPNDVVALFWDDMNPTYDWATNGVYYENTTIDGETVFVVSLVDYAEYGSTGTSPDNTITAQAIFFPNGNIRMQYNAFGAAFDLTSATVGIENVDGTDGVAYAFNDATNFVNELAVEFIRPIPQDYDIRVSMLEVANPTPTVNDDVNFTATVANTGGEDASGFDVQLIDASDDSVLATVSPDAVIAPNGTADVMITYAFTSTGNQQVYATTIWASDGNNDNNHSNTLTIGVQDSGVTAITVGDGVAEVNTHPFNFYYKNSLAETIYLASELNFGGQITGLAYYNNFVTDLTGKPVNIWIGETTDTELTALIPSTDLTAVFAGTIDVPAGQNAVNITFDTPYNYAGGNLVVLTERELDEEYFSSSDKWVGVETELAGRSLYWRSDSVDLDPAAEATAGTASVFMPKTTLYAVIEGMGSVAGTVTDGTNPLANVALAIEGTNYSTMTAADGSFEFAFVAEGTDYVMNASLFGYEDATSAAFNVVEDQETTVNLTMTSLPMVEVSGQVITNDTGAGIQAHVSLTGYQAYEADTDASGYFAIDVYANQTYQGTATAEGYQAGSFTAAVADMDLDLGTVLVTENLYPASNVVAAYDNGNAVITWDEPNTAGGGDAIMESFEGEFPPTDWMIQNTNTTATWQQAEIVSFSDGDVVPTEGSFQAQLGWDYAAQDEWLITNEMTCPAGNLVFDFYGHYGSTHLDNYYVKVSTDGGSNWTALWNATDLPEADNHYDTPISIDLSAYAGQMVKIAWQGVDGDGAGLWYTTFIDNVNIGGRAIRANEIATVSKGFKTSNITRTDNRLKRDINEPAYMPMANLASRAFESYNVYRFLLEDEMNMDNWTLVAEDVTALTYTDTDWSTLAGGFYMYAVAAVYTNGAEATPAVSNYLQMAEMATVTFDVDSNLGTDIEGAECNLVAQVANPDGTFNTYMVETDAMGDASIEVIMGMYDVTIMASGFSVYTGEVDATADVTVTATLDEQANPPTAVMAEQVDDDAVITWGEPGAGGGTGDAVFESFEGEFPPTDWMIQNTNTTATWQQAEVVSFSDGDVVPTEGSFQAQLGWDYAAQDEWLITNEMTCPAGNLVFDFYGHYGSTHLDNYYVNISTDAGSTWTALWNATDLPEGDNHYDAPISIDLSAYAGQMVKIAWQGVDGDGAGLWYTTFIDNVTIGGRAIRANEVVAVSKASRTPMAALKDVSNTTNRLKRDATEAPYMALSFTSDVNAPVVNSTFNTRDLQGYKVWRLLATDQGNEANWTLLTTDAITELTYTDTDWDAQASGVYLFAVKAIYSNDNMSDAAFSNELEKDMYGMVDGTVTDASGNAIAGATVAFDMYSATTDASGYFLFTDVYAGMYDISASATGYVASTQSMTVVGTQLTTVNFSLEASNVIFEDTFESYDDFSLEMGQLTLVDNDLNTTYGFQGTTFLHTGEAMSYIVFNPNSTEPVLDDEAFFAYSGDKYAACFAAMAPSTQNDDWMMTPVIELAAGGSFSFMAKSYTHDYGAERFNVLVSDGSTNPNDFTVISGNSEIEAPLAWTNFTYDLSAYANSSIRLAIQCVSNDAFIFMVDDLAIDAPGGTPTVDNEVPAVSMLQGNYPNPFNPETTIAFSTKENGPVSIDIFNVKGQKVRTLVNDNMEAGNHTVVWNGQNDNGKNVASGVFFYRMKSGKYSSTKKMILMK